MPFGEGAMMKVDEPVPCTPEIFRTITLLKLRKQFFYFIRFTLKVKVKVISYSNCKNVKQSVICTCKAILKKTTWFVFSKKFVFSFLENFEVGAKLPCIV